MRKTNEFYVSIYIFMKKTFDINMYSFIEFKINRRIQTQWYYFSLTKRFFIIKNKYNMFICWKFFLKIEIRSKYFNLIYIAYILTSQSWINIQKLKLDSEIWKNKTLWQINKQILGTFQTSVFFVVPLS